MELKPTLPVSLLTGNIVLIVPLWNWNVIDIGRIAFTEGFNRTFMELKPSKLRASYEQASFNRTFMELKQMMIPSGNVCQMF